LQTVVTQDQSHRNEIEFVGAILIGWREGGLPWWQGKDQA